MASVEEFDVFLAYNSMDRDVVERLAMALKARGLKVWCDLWEAIPGKPWYDGVEAAIRTCRSAIVAVGPDGIGPWEYLEMRACLREFVRCGKPLIPVLLPGAPEKAELPTLLKDFVWVDLRGGITRKGIDHLVWGITGEKVVTGATLGVERLLKPPPLMRGTSLRSYASALLAANLIAEAARDGKRVPEDVRRRIAGLPELRLDWDSFELDGYDVIFCMWLKDTAGRDRELWARVGTMANPDQAETLEQKLLQSIADLGGAGELPRRNPRPFRSTVRRVLIVVLVLAFMIVLLWFCMPQHEEDRPVIIKVGLRIEVSKGRPEELKDSRRRVSEGF